jgi:NADH:ubiquinone oxidoreductase subunit 2 (subunit N)
MTVISREWMSIILSIEVQSSGIYLLVCRGSIASGLRYNIIGGISSSIIIISILQIYSECGLSNIEEIKI